METLHFLITSMPSSRPAKYYLNCLDGQIFIDLNDYDENLVCLKRISFDGYGCCNLDNEVIPMNLDDSINIKKMFQDNLIDQAKLSDIVKRTILNNQQFIWNDALSEYGFL